MINITSSTSINLVLIIAAMLLLGFSGYAYMRFSRQALLKMKRQMDTVLIQGGMCLLLIIIAVLVLFIIAECYWIAIAVGNEKLDITRRMWFVIDLMILFFFYKTIMLLKNLLGQIFIPGNINGK